MITFESDLDLVKFLKEQGYDCSQIEDSLDLESFLKKNESSIGGYSQDLEYQISGSPKYVLESQDKSQLKNYEAVFSCSCFDKNQRLVETPSLIIPVKTTIEYDNYTLGAFEQKVWNMFFKQQSKWMESLVENKNIVTTSSPSMKLLSESNKGMKVLTLEQFKKQHDNFDGCNLYLGTKKFHQKVKSTSNEVLAKQTLQPFTHVIVGKKNNG